MEVPRLETPRLLLKPLESEDAVQVQQVFPRWEIVRHLVSSVPWPFPPDGASRYIDEMALPAMQAGQAWHWSLRHRSNPQTLIGLISLRLGPEDNRGFWLVPEWQKQGLMSEACEAVTAFWFLELQQTRLRVPKAMDNQASRRISERTGMRLVDTYRKTFVEGELLAGTWEITREEWLARNDVGDNPPAEDRMS
ncbi:GNAT family N-acetyltransferase [Candidatus Pantoea formicae]|uniref:GNAT family N-acetyltransferase n=1 Tax=Candidatus Pantoea formicae TaxID=2608355 RepID=UPI003ED9225A